ncbi:protein kinase and PP2C-like domain-containing protein [Impatiens glandulifera]|uniref:protein kinase and PP2C-like domain-containing protein n=1 Tax=Impatiens glandulifera TaxID=253017 RepID=UPI001FB080E9|nr:protein kinase and PP2C-like domain-containing protein [Impatiens glandulifera]
MTDLLRIKDVEGMIVGWWISLFLLTGAEIRPSEKRDAVSVVDLIDRSSLACFSPNWLGSNLSRSGCSYPLSKDHSASCVEERNRVIFAGEDVKWQVDKWRVGSVALQVTRSIGDDDLKPAVTAEPEVIETTLSEYDEYLVMASDGLWDVMSSEDIVSIIKDTIKVPGMCSKRLATEAAKRGSKDNITAIVVFL